MAGEHSKYVQELLGNAGIRITMDTDSRVIGGMDGGLADAVRGGALGPIAAALLPREILAHPKRGRIRIRKPMRP